MFRLVVDGFASGGEEITRARLASDVIVCPAPVGKACKLEIVVRASPQREAHVDSAMEVSKCVLRGLQVSLREIGMGGAKDAQRRGNIGTRAYCRVLETA
jgi:hypothetical protein